MSASLAGKCVLVTQAGDFTGPVLCEVLAARCFAGQVFPVCGGWVQR